MRKLLLHYNGMITPYVRMTQRGKFVSKRGQRYMESQRQLAAAFQRQVKAAGWRMVMWGGGRYPAEVVRLSMLFRLPDMRTRDLSNLVKAAEDAMNPHLASWLRRAKMEGTVQDTLEGIVYEDDRLVWLYGPTAIVHDTEPGCEVLVEAMTLDEYRAEIARIEELLEV